jgi:hypothetical protein
VIARFFDRWRVWKRQRQIQRRLDQAFSRQELLTDLVWLPLLRLNEKSGETKQPGSAPKNKILFRLLQVADRRYPQFRPWRVNLLRRLALRGLCLGLQILSARFSRR